MLISIHALHNCDSPCNLHLNVRLFGTVGPMLCWYAVNSLPKQTYKCILKPQIVVGIQLIILFMLFLLLYINTTIWLVVLDFGTQPAVSRISKNNK